MFTYGIRYNVGLMREYVKDYLRWCLVYRKSPLKDKTFQFNRKQYSYYVHPYNHTWDNERAVELAIILDLLSNYNHKDVLEIGNVVSHYRRTFHDIVDAYEWLCFNRVINKDILEYETNRQYDLIVSISTVEHIGWSESPRNSEKILEVREKIIQLLSDDGMAVITMPVGYNSFLDETIKNGAMRFSNISCLQRISWTNEWIETDLNTVLQCKYNEPYPNGNGVILGTLRKE